MSHAAVIPCDVFLFQFLAVAQAYVVLTDHLLRPSVIEIIYADILVVHSVRSHLTVKFGIKTFLNILCGLLISEILYEISCNAFMSSLGIYE